MKKFYNEYKDDEKVQQLVALLPWGHNILLIDKVKNREIRKKYIEGILANGWSRSVLTMQIENDYYIDLLFYHLDLRCYIVVELKANKFKPEYAG